MIFSIFRFVLHPQIPDSYISAKYCPILNIHMESLCIQLSHDVSISICWPVRPVGCPTISLTRLWDQLRPGWFPLVKLFWSERFWEGFSHLLSSQNGRPVSQPTKTDQAMKQAETNKRPQKKHIYLVYWTKIAIAKPQFIWNAIISNIMTVWFQVWLVLRFTRLLLHLSLLWEVCIYELGSRNLSNFHLAI